MCCKESDSSVNNSRAVNVRGDRECNFQLLNDGREKKISKQCNR